MSEQPRQCLRCRGGLNGYVMPFRGFCKCTFPLPEPRTDDEAGAVSP